MRELQALVCPTCGAPNPKSIGQLPCSHFFAGAPLSRPLQGGNLYRCGNCQLKFKAPVLEAEAYKELYDNANRGTWSSSGRVDWGLVTELVVHHFPKGARVLDFGCYTGGLLAQLGSVYERFGVEINQAAAVMASEKASAFVWSEITAIPPEFRFEVIVAVDVLEHIINPLETIEQLLPLLSDGGILIVTTGDANSPFWNFFGAKWWYCFFPEHISFLCEYWFNYFAERRGWVIIRHKKFRYCHWSIVARIINFLGMVCYGSFPGLYLFFGNLFRKCFGRPSAQSVPGCGVTADHLMIVLARRKLSHEL